MVNGRMINAKEVLAVEYAVVEVLSVIYVRGLCQHM
jgi:hypothetical protein